MWMAILALMSSISLAASKQIALSNIFPSVFITLVLQLQGVNELHCCFDA